MDRHYSTANSLEDRPSPFGVTAPRRVVGAEPLGPCNEAFAIVFGLRHEDKTAFAAPAVHGPSAQGITEQSSRQHGDDHHDDGEPGFHRARN